MSKAFNTLFGPQIRAWRGDAPLGAAFWGYGALMSLAVIAVFLGAMFRGDALVQQAMLILFVLYTAWVLVVIWRCAGSASQPWGLIARQLTIAWAVNTMMIGGALQLALLEGGLRA